jgi:hypothetical protein
VAPLLSIFVVFALFQNCGHQVSSSGGYTNLSPTPTPDAPEPLSISPTRVTLGASQTFAFTVTGGASGGYEFSLSSGPGSVSQAGVYTAPASVGLRNAVATLQVRDASGEMISAQIIISGNGTVLLDPSVRDVVVAEEVLSISPASVTLRAGQSLAFSASGGSRRGYVYTLTSGPGSVSSSGVYTAPLSVGVRGASATLQAKDSSGAVTSARITIAGSSGMTQDTATPTGIISDPVTLGAPQDDEPTR